MPIVIMILEMGCKLVIICWLWFQIFFLLNGQSFIEYFIFSLLFACKQIENEFGPVEWEIGAPGKAYTKWAAEMAVGLGTGVPWVMCKQDDAPDPVVSNFVNFPQQLPFPLMLSYSYRYFLFCFTFSVALLSWWGKIIILPSI